MSLIEYRPGTTFPGRVGRTISESEPAWPAPLRSKPGAPNVVYVVLTGTIHKVNVSLTGPSHHDADEATKAEARVAMARQ